ncbi:MAG: right-handed parallel beta-helix repeat-containing protein, partial [Desulfofustis sp.]|nr:right-handed parallel beta-helix repeat-containing protein [Desulfofustis sp.]
MNGERLRNGLLCCCVLGAVLFGPLSGAAATYYIAADGSDTNDGLSSAAPWQTIDKVNSLGRSAATGSSFLFRRGDIFRGTIHLAGETQNATLASYGEGERPVISGSVEIGGWTKYAGAVYVADVSGRIGAGETIEHLFVDNRRMLLARYPNVATVLPDPDEGWLEVGTSSSKRRFTDPLLGAYGKPAGYWVGGTIRIRTFSWLFETRTIVSSTTAGTITMDRDLTETLADTIQPGWGYYIDNLLGELDREGEWYFDAATRRVYLYAPGGVHPDTVLVEGSIRELGCDLLWHYHGTVIDGLTFRHQQADGVNINQSDRVTIRNCRFENIGQVGVNMAWNSTDLVVENNEFADILDFSFKFIATIDNGGWDPGQSIFRRNVLRNTAVIAGYGGDGVAHACGIRTYGVRGLTIAENIIDNTGYVGIHLEGGDHLVE